MINYIRLNILYKVNKYHRILKLNKTILKIICYLKSVVDYLFSKSLYLTLIILIEKCLDKYLSIYEIIFISTLIGGLFNTLLFSPDKVLHLLSVKYNYHKLFSIYLLKIIFNYLILIIFILSKSLSIENILLIIFISLSKNIFNAFYIELIDKYNYFYKEEEISKYTIIIFIIIVFISIMLILDIISFNLVLIFGMILGLYTTYKIIKIKNIEILYLNMKTDDFYIKEFVSINNKKVKEENDADKYLYKIFTKRHVKYFILYNIKSLLISIIFIILSGKSTIESIMEIFSLMFIINSNNKMINLYYYKCDQYFDKKIIYRNKRITMMLLVSLPSMIILTIYMIVCKTKISFIFIGYLILIFITICKYIIYEKKEIFKNKVPTKEYYYFDTIAIISIIIYDAINIINKL